MIGSEKTKKPINHTGRCFPGKRISTITVVASINKSVAKCGHRLTRVFSEFTHLGASSCRVKGIEVIEEKTITARFDDVKLGRKLEYETRSFNISRRPPILVLERNLLPPLGSDKKGTIVLDLDETLVHTSLGPPPPRYDFVVSRVMDGATVYFYVFKRPGVDEFLEIISKKYEVVVFTAGHREYASQVLDVLDPNGYVSHRFYRDSCKQVRGTIVKDLSEFGRDLTKIVIVDDNPNSYSLQPGNGIPIKPFYGDELWDRELMKLAGFFERCNVFPDMRTAVNWYIRVRTKEIR